MTLETLRKAIFLLVSSVIFHNLSETFPCLLLKWNLISVLHLWWAGIWPPACIFWFRAVLFSCQISCCYTCRAILSYSPLTCPSQQYVLTLICRRPIISKDLIELSHRQSGIYLNRICPEYESKAWWRFGPYSIALLFAMQNWEQNCWECVCGHFRFSQTFVRKFKLKLFQLFFNF